MICPNHNVELVHRQGVSKKNNKPYDFWGCPQKDGANFCDFTAPGNGKAMPITPQREDLVSKALAQIQAQLTRIEAKIDAITPPGVGGYVINPATSPTKKEDLPF